MVLGGVQTALTARQRPDRVNNQVYVNGRRVGLTSLELEVLDVLMGEPNTYIPNGKLLQVISKADSSKASLKKVRMVIHHLRQKIEDDPGKPRLIQSRHNRGYAYREPSSESTNEDLFDVEVSGCRIRIDLKNRIVYSGEHLNRQTDLTTMETSVLSTLVQNRDTYVSREELLEIVWGFKSLKVYGNRVGMLVSRLRRKIEDDPGRPSLILTDHFRGYIFAGRFVEENTPVRDSRRRLDYSDSQIGIDRRKRLVYVEGLSDSPIKLSPSESNILFKLVSMPHYWRPGILEEATGTSRVSVRMCCLRQKLGDDARNPRYIETSRLFGYRYLRPENSTHQVQ